MRRSRISNGANGSVVTTGGDAWRQRSVQWPPRGVRQADWVNPTGRTERGNPTGERSVVTADRSTALYVKNGRTPSCRADGSTERGHGRQVNGPHVGQNRRTPSCRADGSTERGHGGRLWSGHGSHVSKIDGHHHAEQMGQRSVVTAGGRLWSGQRLSCMSKIDGHHHAERGNPTGRTERGHGRRLWSQRPSCVLKVCVKSGRTPSCRADVSRSPRLGARAGGDAAAQAGGCGVGRCGACVQGRVTGAAGEGGGSHGLIFL